MNDNEIRWSEGIDVSKAAPCVKKAFYDEMTKELTFKVLRAMESPASRHFEPKFEKLHDISLRY